MIAAGGAVVAGLAGVGVLAGQETTVDPAPVSPESVRPVGPDVVGSRTAAASLPAYGEQPQKPDLRYERASGFDAARDHFYLLGSPIGFGAFEPELVLVDGDVEHRADLGHASPNGVGSFRRINPGEDRRSLIATAAGPVVVTLDGVMTADPISGESKLLADGIAVLPGPGPDDIWVLSSGDREVRLIDVGSGDEAGRWDLVGLGRPLGPAAGGLVLRPLGGGDRDAAVWWPNGSMVELAGTASADFFGAGGSVVVFGGPSQLTVYDLTDALGGATEPVAGRTLPAALDRPRASVVSPDGQHLALTVITPLTEPNEIAIVDLGDGTIAAVIAAALEFQYRWSSRTTLLYIAPDWPEFALVERDLGTGDDRRLLDFPLLNWWYEPALSP